MGLSKDWFDQWPSALQYKGLYLLRYERTLAIATFGCCVLLCSRVHRNVYFSPSDMFAIPNKV
jgi:hypothetical protein